MYRTLHFSLASLLLAASSSLLAQQQRTLHQAFELNDITTVEFALNDSVEVIPWAGTVLLVETTVHMWEEQVLGRTDAPDAIFKYFIEKGRYQVTGTLLDGQVLRLQSKDMKRPIIQTAKGICTEKVTIRIMLPDTFEQAGPQQWRRKG